MDKKKKKVTNKKQKKATENRLVPINDVREEQTGYFNLMVGIFFLFATVIVLTSIFLAEYLPFLESLRKTVLAIFGKSFMLFPIILAIVGTSILSNPDYSWFCSKNLGLLLITVSLCGILHRQNVPVRQELYPGMLNQGGGLIGGLITLPLNRYFDGNSVFYLLGIMLFFGVLFLIPYLDLFSILAYPVKRFKNFFNGEIENESSLAVKQEVFFEDNDDDLNFDGDEDDREESKKSSWFLWNWFKNSDDNETYEADWTNKDEKPAEKLLPQTVQKKQRNEVTLSAREIIQRRTKDAALRRDYSQQNVQIELPSVSGVYKREEFRKYTDGIRKENVFQKVIGKNKNVYRNVKPEDFDQDGPSTWQEPVTQSNSARTIFGASMFNNFHTNESDNIIPLKSEPDVQQETEMNIQQDTKPVISEPLIIKHYRNSEAEDLEDTEITLPTNHVKKLKAKKAVYKFPKVDLLDNPRHLSAASFEKDIQRQCSILEQTLEDFRVHANIIGVTRGPSITRFEVQPAAGVKVSSITNLADDIALKLAANGVRIEAPIPGKAAVGIEVPNLKTDPVFLREVVEDEIFKIKDSPVCVGLGRDINGDVITMDIDRMPHLLIAGSTGSGKSVCINTIICNILFRARPDEVKLILVDPKVVELSNYNCVPHLLTPVVTDMKKAASALHWAVKEMERRYTLFADNHAREINGYNLKAEEKLPYIIVIIDELSDLMMVARIDVEDAILRLAQKARAAGIHLILATQRPSVDVITGIIKANIPSRIAFAVSSQTDSRTILDMGGADKLIGHGDMLYFPIGVNKPLRVQGAFVSDDEINRIVDYVTNQAITPAYVEEITTQKLSSDQKDNSFTGNSMLDDDIFLEVLRLVMDTGQVSASMLQRRFRIGYTRAARLVDNLEELGVVGPALGSKPRELIMSNEEITKKFFNE